jgi:hypothetical protein
VAQSGAEVLVAADSGCLMNIGGALARARRPTRCLPLAQFIAERTAPGGAGSTAPGGAERTQSGRAAGTQGGGHAA